MAQQSYQPQRGGSAHGSGGRFGNGASNTKTLPTPRAIQYFQADGALVPALMDSQAEELAQQLSQVTTTQLRRFYDDVLTLRQRLAAEQRQGRDKEALFNELRADFKMLKAKAVYAHGRSEKTMPRPLLQFFIDHVAAVNNAREFEAFCKHFQAVVAFHKFYGENK